MTSTGETQPSSNTENELEVRFANEKDADSLARLIQELLTFYGMPLKYQRSFMSHTIENSAFRENSGVRILLALQKGQAVGFLAFSVIFALATCQNSIFIQDLYVERKTRNSGIGRALMRTLVEYGLENDITQLDWTTDTWNSKAINFYETITSLQKSEKIFYRLNKEKLTLFLKSAS
jgi:ribosomal protein S18 acetylase RimI-like enzyme